MGFINYLKKKYKNKKGLAYQFGRFCVFLSKRLGRKEDC